VDLSQAGNVVVCPQLDCGLAIAIPPAAQVAQPLPRMERCYDCRRPIPEGEVCRREVRVSSSYSSGSIIASASGGRNTSGTYGGSSSTYAKVSLCPRCNARREAERRQREANARACMTVFVIAVIVTVIIILAGAFAVAYWLAAAEQRAVAQAKAEAEAKARW
jgi:hypothetical protein